MLAYVELPLAFLLLFGIWCGFDLALYRAAKRRTDAYAVLALLLALSMFVWLYDARDISHYMRIMCIVISGLLALLSLAVTLFRRREGGLPTAISATSLLVFTFTELWNA